MKRRSFLMGLFGAPLLAVPVARSIAAAESRYVLMDLQPGETVDIWRPHTVVGAGGGGRLFDRATLRNLIDELNDLQADGYPLKRDR